jgi:hypothetical protein
MLGNTARVSLPGDLKLPDYEGESVPRVPAFIKASGPSGTGTAMLWYYTEGIKAQTDRFRPLLKSIRLGFF